jgi:hypothetical protein
MTDQTSREEDKARVAGGYRPPEWGESAGDIAQLILIRPNIADDVTGYFFDAVLKEEHTLQSKKTEHPVQTGAPVADHIYNMPDKITLEISMSDVMDSFIPGQWEAGSSGSRSVNAWQTLRRLQKERRLLSVTTGLHTYKNMLITNDVTTVSAPDEKAGYGMLCKVTLEELMFATVAEHTVSGRPQTTETNNKGNARATTPKQTQQTAVAEKKTPQKKGQAGK